MNSNVSITAMKQVTKHLFPVADVLLAPLAFPSAWVLGFIRKTGVGRLPVCRKVLINVGVFPIRDHYYEPQFNHRNRSIPLSENRNLPGIDWNINGQLDFLERLTHADELADIRQEKSGDLEFYMGNKFFGPGDAEYWYQVIRHLKPKRIFEVGSGNSTLMAIRAIRKNREEDHSYECKHVCIEPYEAPWLEKAGVQVLRKKVEDVELSYFGELEENDIVFIDSSHIIRPHGDVLFEYLQLLPALNDGVVVHVHDIFSPRNYPKCWLEDQMLFWNEQYILESFLSNNDEWKIIGALNFLRHSHYEKLRAVAPFLADENEPGSFYIQKRSALKS